MQHILSAEQFSPDQLAGLFAQADGFRETDQAIASRRDVLQTHTGRIMLSMFYEPSTRTRFSFEIAATKLGIGVVGTENAAEFSSAAKGETIEDTVKVFNEYGVDALSMRTKEEGHADRAAAVSKIAVINGGDGKGEHPTQAVLDLYTIKEQLGRLDGLNVVMGGDLAHGRTVRSLAKMLAKYPGNKISFVSTPELQISEDIKLHLAEHDTDFAETTDMYEALRGADVVYWTRLQLERHRTDKDISVGQEHFVIDATALEVLPSTAIILHPLPRNKEISASTDSDPRAKYFRQAGNGLYVRMALLDQVMKNRT
ncbi:aspartate carbamoyltransferase [Polaromonas sp.]|nr:aspartate carbamoyltransferase [Candidatus Saccharibacteria bacterium]